MTGVIQNRQPGPGWKPFSPYPEVIKLAQNMQIKGWIKE